MFQLPEEEHANSRSRIATSRSWGRRTAPFAFTGQGVAMRGSRKAPAISATGATARPSPELGADPAIPRRSRNSYILSLTHPLRWPSSLRTRVLTESQALADGNALFLG